MREKILLDQGRILSKDMIINRYEEKKISQNNMRKMKEVLLLKLVYIILKNLIISIKYCCYCVYLLTFYLKLKNTDGKTQLN